MDNLILDADSLFAIADVISGYCAQQRETLNVYYAQIMALESEWRDDETFGAIAEGINKLKTSAVSFLDEINEVYPKYFREKARLILSRPTIQSTSTGMGTSMNPSMSPSMSMSTSTGMGTSMSPSISTSTGMGTSISVDTGTGISVVRGVDRSNSLTSARSIQSPEYAYPSASYSHRVERTIPGTPGIVTGGDSAKLGKNMLSDMGVSRDIKWGASGYQAHHVIPKEFSTHPVIQKIGMDMDDASNGLFLRTPNEGVNVKSVHHGYHEEYSNAVKKYLDRLDLSQSIEFLEERVADLQHNLKIALERGVPLYMKKEKPTIGSAATYKHKGGGARQEMWDDNAIRSDMDYIKKISIPDDLNRLDENDKVEKDAIESFENKEYEARILTKSLTVYRYFGSFSRDEMVAFVGEEEVCRREKNGGWGAEAGGAFLSLTPNLTASQIKSLLALNSKWGNSAVYVSTVELPEGTTIFIGRAAPQTDYNGERLPGGEIQIFLRECWTTELVKERIKACRPISIK